MSASRATMKLTTKVITAQLRVLSTYEQKACQALRLDRYALSVLEAVAAHEGDALDCSQLALTAGLARPRVSGALAALEQGGYVISRSMPTDKRRLAIEASAKGAQAAAYIETLLPARTPIGSKLWKRVVGVVRGNGMISLSEFRILLLLTERKSAAVGEIARDLLMPQSTTSMHLLRLTAKEFVSSSACMTAYERMSECVEHSSKSDARYHRYIPSEAGKELIIGLLTQCETIKNAS